MDYLRAGIGLRAMGQRDPLSEYQREAFDMFTEMVDSVKRDTVRYLYHVEVAQPKSQPQRVEAAPAGSSGPRPQAQSDKVGRNDPCPCGSGKKYKRCHGAA
jgi:preprotein translocase subunit SecA